LFPGRKQAGGRLTRPVLDRPGIQRTFGFALVSRSQSFRPALPGGKQTRKIRAMKVLRLLALASLFIVSVNARATLMREQFATDPALDGWQIFGDTNLFQWDPVNHNLAVTWDSSQTNSFFYHPLDRTYTTNDSFCVQFDLTLTNTVAKGYFEVAVGLCNLAEATATGFSRANVTSPNLFEFDYYPDGPESWGPSIDATLADSHLKFYFAGDYTQALPLNVACHVVLIHQANTATISGAVFTNGQVMTVLPSVYAKGGAGAFQLDTLAINNYTTLDDPSPDSLFAQGSVADLSFASPLPVGLIQAPAAGQVQLVSDPNWRYTLEQTTDFQTWTAAAPAVPGNGGSLRLQATNAPADKAFYRVRADLP